MQRISLSANNRHGITVLTLLLIIIVLVLAAFFVVSYLRTRPAAGQASSVVSPPLTTASVA